MLHGALAGLAAGGVYAVLGVCLTVMYRLAGVISFGLAAVGMAGVYVMLALYGAGAPYPVAAPAGVLAAGLLAGVLGLVTVHWFAESGPDTRSAVTIAYLVGIVAISYLLWGDHPRPVPAPVHGPLLHIAGVVVTKSSAVSIALAAVLAVVVQAILGRTTVGLKLRALSERPTTAELLGVPVRPLVVATWFSTGALVCLGLVLIAPERTSDQFSLSLLVVPGCAAALIGGLRHVYGALVGGLLVGVLQGVFSQVDVLQKFRDAAPFFVILLILVWSRRQEVWDAAH